MTLTASEPAWAFGFPGCPNLPEYARAVGTLDGLSTCGLTVEEARRIVAAHDGPAVLPQEGTPLPQAHRPRHGRAPHHRAAAGRRHPAR
ncbi:hypothetical protein F6X51_19130 [Methylobacterium planeticum]|uniref:Uncharacterized protein n=1 Tax=Methylobacterium planeticum TaxID=2615211 RepID=A0A6N6MNZ0_9HYPH|nr:hypothetical protein F6X51_19130 [Methylobacterium planeticum]